MALAVQPAASETGPAVRRWKWTGDELVRLASLGAFPPEARIELMDGEIIEKMPTSPLHDALVEFITKLLDRFLAGGECHARGEKTVRLNQYFDPKPDVAVVTGSVLDYASQYPIPPEVRLIIEVADSSLQNDRREKLAAYASAGISDYWIVNLRDQQIEVYREPAEAEYLTRRDYKLGESISPLAAPEISLTVDALLGREQAA